MSDRSQRTPPQAFNFAVSRAGRPARHHWQWNRLTLSALPVILVLLIIADAAAAQEHHSNPWPLSWIPATCCVTNDCCWEISESDLRPLPNDRWEVISTGQVRKRTDWSPDGKFYRCACDYDRVSKHWVRHQGANTRCLFVPMRTARH